MEKEKYSSQLLNRYMTDRLANETEWKGNRKGTKHTLYSDVDSRQRFVTLFEGLMLKNTDTNMATGVLVEWTKLPKLHFGSLFSSSLKRSKSYSRQSCSGSFYNFQYKLMILFESGAHDFCVAALGRHTVS